MKREYILVTLFFLITAIFFYLFYQLVVPFFAPICWAAVFAIIFYPLYEKLLVKFKNKTITSLTICLLILILIIGPVAYLFGALVSEATTVVTKVNEMKEAGELDTFFSSINLPWLESIKKYEFHTFLPEHLLLDCKSICHQ